MQAYQQVAEELEAARQQVSRLSSENQRLRALHQQLSGEIAAIGQEFQGQLGQALKRLQQISLQLADATGASGASFQQDSSIADPSQPETPPSYDFLNRLKRRQARSETSSFSSNSFASPPLDSLRRSPPSTCLRQDNPRTGYQVPSLDELMQDPVGSDPYLGEADSFSHPSGIYQRVREQHHGSQGSPVLWMAAAVLLVVGSFGLGFLAVQPFLRNNPPPVQAP
ncbi:WXG100 family type VII secretion target [Synechococcus sp. H55.2]|uniref:WXG100 family type VII secretion target n=1 Tax=unclassified Synechococcus TaxID=2626047 RepID=UPI0039C3661A